MNIRKASDQFLVVLIVAIVTLTVGFLLGVKAVERIADQNDRIADAIGVTR